MRKSGLICVLMISLLLTGCGGGGKNGPMDRALAVRGTYLAANGCTARIRVSADYGQRVYNYVLDVTVTGQDTTLRVSEPAEIEGMTARLRMGESTLEYDGAILETGPLAADGLTPISAVAALFEAARSGFIGSSGTEGENLYILCRDPAKPPDQGREITLWFGPDDRLLRGEVSVDGRRVVSCEFLDFALT